MNRSPTKQAIRDVLVFICILTPLLAWGILVLFGAKRAARRLFVRIARIEDRL